jgi:hypothetical protein
VAWEGDKEAEGRLWWWNEVGMVSPCGSDVGDRWKEVKG